MTELRIIRPTIRAKDSTGRAFWARVVSYDQPDSYGTTFAPGAFAEGLAERLPTLLYGHNYLNLDNVLGRATDSRESREGLDLLFEFADFDAVPTARQASALLASGALDGFSVGFEREGDEPDPNHRGVTRITKASLTEVSVVLDPAVPGTKVLAMRARHGLVPLGRVVELAQEVRAGRLSVADAERQLRAIAETAPVARQDGSGAPHTPPAVGADADTLAEADDALRLVADRTS